MTLAKKLPVKGNKGFMDLLPRTSWEGRKGCQAVNVPTKSPPDVIKT
jgi:hypothetical protein